MSTKRLQVKTGWGWKYVFCRGHNIHTGVAEVVTTTDRKKAVKADKYGFDYFKSHFPYHKFRIEV